ncbi:MAG: hypothetical protein ABR576_14330 [Thermoanaerobaculia bacterium]
MSVRLLHAALLATALLSGCRERGRPDPDVRMAISHDPETPAGAEAGPARVGPARLEVPAEVGEAYSGIRLRWRDAASQKEGVLEVPLNGAARVPGTSLDVHAEVFLPSFTMSQDVITSAGVESDNPAARIEVSEEGKSLFAGWVFTRFPDVHPFTHPRVSLRLEGGVRSASP